MTTRYANPSGSNTSPYDTWAKGATDPQTIIDLAVAGDINIYGGTFTDGTHFTGPLDVDTNAGSTSNYILHLGCNGSGVIDGTRCVIDANSNAASCFNIDVAYHRFEHFEAKNGTSFGFDYNNAAADYITFINCIAHDNGINGFHTGNTGNNRTLYILCRSYDNTSDGIGHSSAVVRLFFCALYNNGALGFDGSLNSTVPLFYGCLVHNNTSGGLIDLDDAATLINCIIDGESVGVDFDDQQAVLIGNRITNCTTGIDFNTKHAIAGWNHFYNNSSNDVLAATLAMNLADRAGLTNRYMSAGIDGTNTVDTGSDDGYNDRANDDFNLKTTAENRRIEVDMEVGV